MASATILTSPGTGLSGNLLKRYSAVCSNPIFRKDQNMKNINTISMHGEKFYQFNAAQRQLLRPLNNLEETDPSEIERTYNIRKELTRFY